MAGHQALATGPAGRRGACPVRAVRVRIFRRRGAAAADRSTTGGHHAARIRLVDVAARFAGGLVARGAPARGTDAALGPRDPAARPGQPPADRHRRGACRRGPSASRTPAARHPDRRERRGQLRRFARGGADRARPAGRRPAARVLRVRPSGEGAALPAAGAGPPAGASARTPTGGGRWIALVGLARRRSGRLRRGTPGARAATGGGGGGHVHRVPSGPRRLALADRRRRRGPPVHARGDREERLAADLLVAPAAGGGDHPGRRRPRRGRRRPAVRDTGRTDAACRRRAGPDRSGGAAPAVRSRRGANDRTSLACGGGGASPALRAARPGRGQPPRGRRSADVSPPREIVVVELLGGFGDLLLALPAGHALARAPPEAPIRVGTLAPGETLLTADPAVRSVTVAQADNAAAGVADHLDRYPADLAVSTTMHSGIAELLAARVPRAVTNLWRSPPPDELVDRRFLRVLADDGLIAPADVRTPLLVVLTDDERAQAARLLDGLLEDAGPTPGPPVLVLPGAGMPIKRWPEERWQSLAERLTSEGCQMVTVADAADLLPGACVLPPVDLRTLAAVAADVGRRGGAAVGGDTGPVRLATAAGCPAVGLYGPTLAARYGLSDPTSENLQGLPGCPVRRPTAITEQECWWSARCPLTGGGGPACMADISVATVEAALRRLLGRQVPTVHAGVGRST